MVNHCWTSAAALLPSAKPHTGWLCGTTSLRRSPSLATAVTLASRPRNKTGKSLGAPLHRDRLWHVSWQRVTPRQWHGQRALCAHHLPNGQATNHREDDPADLDHQRLENRDDRHSTSHRWHEDHDCSSQRGTQPAAGAGASALGALVILSPPPVVTGLANFLLG